MVCTLAALTAVGSFSLILCSVCKLILGSLSSASDEVDVYSTCYCSVDCLQQSIIVTGGSKNTKIAGALVPLQVLRQVSAFTFRVLLAVYKGKMSLQCEGLWTQIQLLLLGPQQGTSRQMSCLQLVTVHMLLLQQLQSTNACTGYSSASALA